MYDINIYVYASMCAYTHTSNSPYVSERNWFEHSPRRLGEESIRVRTQDRNRTNQITIVFRTTRSTHS